MLFLLISTTCLSQSKHLTIMGIPINGDINSFGARLSRKGIKPDIQSNKSLPFGERRFHGLYMGKNCAITVRYTAKTKTVYGIEIGFSDEDKNIVDNLVNNFYNGIKEKYKDCYDMIPDDDGKECYYIFNTNKPGLFNWNNLIGILRARRMAILAQPKKGYEYLEDKISYSVMIYYIDRVNLDLKDKELLDDI